mmetsp:Transcript_74828/g.232241  ORF Transcript_74828/g.232241 Transcript_74828/m.232241 type:complete len:827 (+) Transcript_74828:126-2606(+)
MTVAELAARLRQGGITRSKGQKLKRLSTLLADVIELIEEAIDQDELEARGQEAAEAVEVAAQRTEPDDAAHGCDAEGLFAQLAQLDPRVSKEDYFDAATGEWDMHGLMEDCRLAQQEPGPPGVAPSPAPAAGAHEGASEGTSAVQAQSLFEQLLQLDAGANKEDYFDPDTMTWDLDGLRDDLSLALSSLGTAAADSKAQAAQEKPQALHEQVRVVEEERPEDLWAQLLQLDPEAHREDYFNPAAQEWDLEGLRDDLRLAQSRPAAMPPGGTTGTESAVPEASGQSPEDLLAKLMELQPDTSKEDYFDAETGEWDVEGMQDDLGLIRESLDSPASAGAPGPTLASAPVAQVARHAEPEAGAGSGDDAQSLLAQLRAIDPTASQEDYFNSNTQQWDMEGLREDLALIAAARGHASPAGGPQEPVAASAQEEAAVQGQAVAAEAAAQAQAPPAADAGAVAAESTEAPPAPLGVGDLVQAKFEEYGWYTAVVKSDNRDGTYTLTWDEDGTASAVSREKIQLLPPITVGGGVNAIWSEDGGWYSAVVQKDNGDGTYVVKYDEDDTEATLKKEEIRSKVDPPPEPKYWAAPYREGDAPPKEAERVEAFYQDDHHEGWYLAVVQKDNRDGSFLLKWEEDNTESAVKREDIRTMRLRLPIADLKVGQKYHGAVTSVTAFGAFVDIGTEKDGLVNASKMSTTAVTSPADVVQKGQAVDVWVNSAGAGELDLVMHESLVGSSSSPPRRDVSAFRDVAGSTWLTGKVVRLAAWGFFVEVAPPSGGPAQQGTVHISNIRTGYVESVQNEVEMGQEVRVRLDNLDEENNRLTFTMKEPA